MPTTCPRCAAAFNVAEAFCGRCGWNAPYLVRRQTPRHSEVSFAERYRGTDYETQALVVAAPDPSITRGRMFVVLASGSLTALALAIVFAQPPV